MVVHGGPLLHFGHLGERQAQPAAQLPGGDADLGGQGPAQGDGEATPELRGPEVEHHGGVVVVAVGAQRLADLGVVLVVPLVAPPGPPVGTGGAAMSRSAPVAVASGPVHGAEGGCSEGDEGHGMICDGLGDSFASAGDPGREDLEVVAAVQERAGRAHALAAVAAAFEQNPVGFVGGAVSDGSVGVAEDGPEPHRSYAVSAPGELGVPSRVVGATHPGELLLEDRRVRDPHGPQGGPVRQSPGLGGVGHGRSWNSGSCWPDRADGSGSSSHRARRPQIRQRPSVDPERRRS